MDTVHRFRRLIVAILLPVGLACLAASAAGADPSSRAADPPSRVGRINLAEGPLAFAPAGDNEWTDAQPNRPLTRGDRLWTDAKSRADVQLGSSAVRMDGATHLEIVALDEQSAQLSITQGSVHVRVRSLPENENFEIDTPNLAYRAAFPGDYRIDVDAANGTTRVTIHSGVGAVFGEGGETLPLGGGQQMTFRGKTLVQVATQESPPLDNFDRWATERGRREDQAISARYVPREVVGYQQLDAFGKWVQDANLGAVWIPQSLPAQWAPYRNGHWDWIAPWGWTWMDDAAWGFAPFHYGRWTQVDSKWAWVPGRLPLKPVYSPALVAFMGGGTPDNWGLGNGPGKKSVAWFPLAPNEAWQPPYAASPVYMNGVNRNLPVQPNATYTWQRSAEALTAIPGEDFLRGKPARAGWMQVATNMLTQAKVVAPPPMPRRAEVAEAARAVPARPAPPVAAQVATVAAAKVTPAASAAALQASQQLLAQRQTEAKAKAEAQARASAEANAAAARQATAEQARQLAAAKQAGKRVEPPRREELARRADKPRREQVAKRTEPRREQVAKRAETQRLEKARAEMQARKAQEAKVAAAEKARRTAAAEQARKAAAVAAASRKAALAAAEERSRQEAHAATVEQARRAAEQEGKALADARTKREEAAAREKEKREAEQRDIAQREAAQRAQQQALAEQWKRDRALYEQQQRERLRGRPDLREIDRRGRSPDSRAAPSYEPIS